MTSPDVNVWLVAAYALALLGVAWVVDVLGSRSARRSLDWRHADFVYHDGVDGWKCHEDQWLWPTAFDPDKRVIRYEGAHAICGRCPSKDVCSPTPGPREITRPVDPWPYSEAGRFHRGVALAVACVGVFVPLLMSLVFHDAADLIVLGTTLAVVVVGGVVPLARHLWNTPDNAPAHLPHVGSRELRADDGSSTASSAPVAAAARPSGYRSVREAAAAVAAAHHEATSAGRTVKVSFVGAPSADSRAGRATPPQEATIHHEPGLRRVSALRTRRRVPETSGPDAEGARRSWPSAWNDATTRSGRTEEPRQ